MPGNNQSNNQSGRSNNQNGYTNNQNQRTSRRLVLHAPFNFVPLPATGTPVIPKWGNQVSLDFPFEDGLSGKITLDIKAVTDIFVRDGSGSDFTHVDIKAKDDSEYLWYYIPGSSIKGALRSMLEIVTFGKLTQFNNESFADEKNKDAYNVESAIPKDLRDNAVKDFAELMFGYTDKTNSLKGRVHVGHAFASSPVEREEVLPKKYILGSPHPSYYPLYLTDGAWKIKDSALKPKINGFKRYPLREWSIDSNVENNSKKEKDENELIISEVVPLGAGSKFSTTIVFHNLKPVELGALLYVLTTPEYHQLGGLKPFGYGRVKLSITELKLRVEEGEKDFDKVEYIHRFEEYMQEKSGKTWETSETLTEFLAMCSVVLPEGDKAFSYMTSNEFSRGKLRYKDGERLDAFTQVYKREYPSIADKEDEAEWEIEEGQTYQGKVFDDGLCIFHPDRNSGKKAINKVKFETSSENLPREATFSFTILEKNEDSVVIQVKNRTNRYYR